MNRKTIAFIALSSLAAAAELKITDSSRSAVDRSNGMAVSCGQVQCSSSTGPSYSAITTMNSAVSFRSFTSLLSADAATITRTPIATASADSPVGAPATFILAGDRVVTTVDQSQAEPRPDYSNPITSMAFNTFSTSLVSAADLLGVPTPAVTHMLAATYFTNAPPKTATTENAQGEPSAAEPSNGPVNAGDPTITQVVSSPIGSDTPEPTTDLMIGSGLVAAGVMTRVRTRK